MKSVKIEVCDEPEIQYAVPPELIPEIRAWLMERGGVLHKKVSETAVYYDTKNNRLLREGVEYRVKEKGDGYRHDMKVPFDTREREVVPDEHGVVRRSEVKRKTGKEKPRLDVFRELALLAPINDRVKRFFDKELHAKFRTRFTKEKFDFEEGFEATLKPKIFEDWLKLGAIAQRMAAEDESFDFSSCMRKEIDDTTTTEITLKGQNRDHIEGLISAITRDFGAGTYAGAAAERIEISRPLPSHDYAKVEYSFQVGYLETMDRSRRTEQLHILELELRDGIESLLLDEKMALEEEFGPKGLVMLKERKILMGFGLLEADMNREQRQDFENVRRRNDRGTILNRPAPAQPELIAA